MGQCAEKPNHEKMILDENFSQEQTTIKNLMKEVCLGGGGLWPDCLIRYRFDEDMDPELTFLITEAIEEWNHHNTPHCSYTHSPEFPFPVLFTQNNKNLP